MAAPTVSYLDRSGTITTGGTAQTIASVNAERVGFYLQNLSTTDLWISTFGNAAAAAPSIKIGAGALYECPANGIPQAAISIFGATTGQAFAAAEW